MAMGLGQRAGEFSHPDDEYGVATWSQMTGVDEGHPFVSGPAVGGFDDPMDQTGLVHVAAGGTAAEDTGSQHWSQLLDWKHSPLPWLLGLTLMWFGLVHLSVAGRVGR